MSKRKKKTLDIKVKQGHISYEYVEDDITHSTAGSWLLCEDSDNQTFKRKQTENKTNFQNGSARIWHETSGKPATRFLQVIYHFIHSK